MDLRASGGLGNLSVAAGPAAGAGQGARRGRAAVAPLRNGGAEGEGENGGGRPGGERRGAGGLRSSGVCGAGSGSRGLSPAQSRSAGSQRRPGCWPGVGVSAIPAFFPARLPAAPPWLRVAAAAGRHFARPAAGPCRSGRRHMAEGAAGSWLGWRDGRAFSLGPAGLLAGLAASCCEIPPTSRR